MCMMFLHDLGTFFLDVREKEVKHALAGIFVEILLPVAGVSLCFLLFKIIRSTFS